MHARLVYRISAIALVLFFSAGCAFEVPLIEAIEAPAEEYAQYDCAALEETIGAVNGDADTLYQGFVQRRKGNRWKVWAAILVFSPFALLMDKDDPAEIEEYARLKGEFHALYDSARHKRCDLDSLGIEDHLHRAQALPAPG